MFFFHLGSGLLIITSTTSPARPSVQNSQFLQSVRPKILVGLDRLLTTLDPIAYKILENTLYIKY